MVIFAIIFLFVLMTLGFIFLAFFFPEWVGIQGKKAREIELRHKEETPKNQSP